MTLFWPLVVAIVCTISMQAQDSQQKFAELGKCKLENGQTIDDCRVGYRTFGQLISIVWHLGGHFRTRSEWPWSFVWECDSVTDSIHASVGCEGFPRAPTPKLIRSPQTHLCSLYLGINVGPVLDRCWPGPESSQLQRVILSAAPEV